MFQETTDETCRLKLTYGQANQTVIGMTKMATVETHIAGEESHRSDMVQEWDNLVVFYPLSTDFVADLANPDPPATQELPLAVREVLIQYVHAVTGFETSFGA
jgi:hypothetical protein